MTRLSGNGPAFWCAALGLLAAAIVLLAVAFDPQAALRAWLAAAFFASSLPIGALCLVMMMRLIPGLWDEELEPFAEAALVLMPAAALVFVPVLAGLEVLYGWTQDPGEGAFRAVYLTHSFFVLRTVLFFAAALGLAFLLLARRAWSTPVSVIGLCVFVILGNLVVTDWLVSLDGDFHSSGFGLYALSIQVTVAFCVTIAAASLSNAKLARPGILGALLLTSLILWAYLAFMQYFILWSGNLPAGAAWYQHRARGFWSSVEVAIATLHLAPIALLLFPPIRSSRIWLASLCGLVLVGKTLEAAWLVLPAGGEGGPMATGLAVPAIVGLAILFALAFLAAIRHRSPSRTVGSPAEEPSS